jgi:hypothetical protein
MVLKEETADVVLFRESVDGERAEQMPRVQCGSEPRRRGGTCVGEWVSERVRAGGASS